MIQRRQAGAYWHSKSRGESLFGEESIKRDLVIEGAAIAVLCLFSWMYAAFFCLSRVLGYIADAMARAAFHNKYLDIEDAKIEAKFMEVALRDGLAPGHTAGYYMPLSSGLKGKFRANVARVVSDGMGEVTGFRPTEGEAQQSETAPEIAEPSPKIPKVDPYEEIRVSALSSVNRMMETGRAILATFRAKAVQYRRNALILLVVILTIWGGVFIVRSIQRHSAESVAASNTPAVTNSPSAGSPLVSAAAAVEAPGKPNPRQVSGKTRPVPADSTEYSKKLQEIVETDLLIQKRQEKEMAVKAIWETVDCQNEKLMKFARDCDQRLVANSNSISEVRMTHRRELHKKNDEARNFATYALFKENGYLARARESLKQRGTSPAFAPQTEREKLDASIAEMEKERLTISNRLNEVEAAISAAPAKMKLKIPW
ncbi:MAG TPA: hypothetical protein VK327_05815, partial [Candidatus Paceibacterota bacterium]|nr:hypothetical protein [Candidatus Paceibacterota bacterium]